MISLWCGDRNTAFPAMTIPYHNHFTFKYNYGLTCWGTFMTSFSSQGYKTELVHSCFFILVWGRLWVVLEYLTHRLWYWRCAPFLELNKTVWLCWLSNAHLHTAYYWWFSTGYVIVYRFDQQFLPDVSWPIFWGWHGPIWKIVKFSEV